jgi:hypothetical protein
MSVEMADSHSTSSFRSAPQEPAAGYFPDSPNVTPSTEKANPIGSQKPPPALSILDIGKALIAPIIAIAYLAFCYVVHDRPVRLSKLVDVTPENLCRCYQSLNLSPFIIDMRMQLL